MNAQLAALGFNALPARARIGMVLPHETTTVLHTISNVWGLGDSPTDIIMYGLIARLNVMSGAPGNGLTGVVRTAAAAAHLTVDAASVLGGTTIGAANLASNNMAAVPATAPGNFFRSCVTAFDTAARWIFELCAANQVRALNPDNVHSYFQSQGIDLINGAPILTIINPVSGMIANIVRDNVARGALEMTDWQRYHISATSTPHLVQRAIDFIGASIPGFWAAATIASVTAAIAAPWDKDLADVIPRKAVAATHAILSELRQCPRDWIQGKKAKTAIPASTYAAWLTMAGKLQDLIINNVAINAATTFAQLTAATPGACLNC